MNIGKKFKQILYKNLSFEQYLRMLSRFYFFSYRSGILKNNYAIQYPYFLKKVIEKDDVVIDIGANLGYYSCLFARWVGNTGKIYAVEPVEPIRNVLKKNVKKYSWVEILPYALGEENKPIQLGNDSIKKNGYVASGSHFVMDAVNNPEMIKNPEIIFDAEMRKGSELFKNLSRLDFIKCDVEGYEAVIIPEIQVIISQYKPLVLIETGSDNRLKITKIMQDMDYAPFVLENKKLRPLSSGDTADILFIHNESARIPEKLMSQKK